jgi:biopolymer transport protein ExbD/biopolymer transport protein TolR
MTPMIDVLLVLIIIFMVIAPVRSRGLPALLPQMSGAHAEVSHTVVVTVRGDGLAMINQEVVDLAALRDRLATLYRNAGSRVIFVRGERGIEFARVAEVIDIARGAGVYQVALMTT